MDDMDTGSLVYSHPVTLLYSRQLAEHGGCEHEWALHVQDGALARLHCLAQDGDTDESVMIIDECEASIAAGDRWTSEALQWFQWLSDVVAEAVDQEWAEEYERQYYESCDADPISNEYDYDYSRDERMVFDYYGHNC